MTVIYRIFLIISSLSPTLGIFLANKGFKLIDHLHPKLPNYMDFLICCMDFLIYFSVCVLIAWFSVLSTKFLSDDTISEGSVTEIESANEAYLPSYLGYFFVALSTQDYGVFFFAFSIICIFIFYSRAAYFNPMYFLFCYRFYYATTDKNVKVLLITRQNLKDPSTIYFDKIKRINDFAFIDLKGKP
jgi:hypothetical protein